MSKAVWKTIYVIYSFWKQLTQLKECFEDEEEKDAKQYALISKRERECHPFETNWKAYGMCNAETKVRANPQIRGQNQCRREGEKTTGHDSHTLQKAQSSPYNTVFSLLSELRLGWVKQVLDCAPLPYWGQQPKPSKKKLAPVLVQDLHLVLRRHCNLKLLSIAECTRRRISNYNSKINGAAIWQRQSYYTKDSKLWQTQWTWFWLWWDSSLGQWKQPRVCLANYMLT